MTTPADQPLLSVRNLVKDFGDGAGGSRLKAKTPVVHAVADVSFDLVRGEVLSLVGESGCGKSTTGRAIMQITKPTSGSVVFEGTDLTELSRAEAAENTDLTRRAQRSQRKDGNDHPPSACRS